MSQTVMDELGGLDAAFAGNRLLATFSAETRALIEPFATITDLTPGEPVLTPGKPVTASVFPFGSTVVSLLVEISGGRTVEVASIGSEGAIGGIVSCGHAPAFSEGRVLIGGPALVLPLDALEDAKRRSNFVNHIFCRFADYLLAQVMQSGACNAFHSIPQRAARWLLVAQDRAGDRLELTQEALASLLGVQRTSLNAVLGELQAEGLIAAGRGSVRVLDRAGLKRRSCECYAAVESHFADVIGPGGVGGSGAACH